MRGMVIGFPVCGFFVYNILQTMYETACFCMFSTSFSQIHHISFPQLWKIVRILNFRIIMPFSDVDN